MIFAGVQGIPNRPRKTLRSRCQPDRDLGESRFLLSPSTPDLAAVILTAASWPRQGSKRHACQK